MKVAIILGNRMNDDGTLSDLCKARLELTKELDSVLNPYKIILSGGMPNKKAGLKEADEMYKALVEEGFDKEKLVKENNSLTTYENAKFAIPMAKEIGATEIIVCSSSEHIGRIYFNPIGIFKKRMKEYPELKLRFYVGD